MKNLTVFFATITLSIIGYGRPLPHQFIFLDSITNSYVVDLQKQSVSYIIVYSKKKNVFNKDPIQNYVIWRNNGLSYLKYFNFNSTNTPNSGDVFNKTIIVTGGLDSLLMTYSDENVPNRIYCRKDLRPLFNFSSYKTIRLSEFVEEITYISKVDSFYFYKRNPESYIQHGLYDEILSCINDIIFRAGDNFQLQTSLIPDSLFFRRYLEKARKEHLAIVDHRNTTLRNLIECSNPITDDELSEKSKLEREAYKLYEYIINSNILEKSIPDKEEIRYFLVPYLRTGHYIITDSTRFVRYQITEKKDLKDFRPRLNNESIEQFLYINEDVRQYYREYDKYGLLPGVYHTKSTLMSGYMQFIESPPAIYSILFNDTYDNAIISFRVNSVLITLIMQNSGNDWFVYRTIAVQEHD